MPAQLGFSFSNKKFLPEDFIVTESNKLAFEQILSWPQWPAFSYILLGEKYSGKSYLASIWQKKSAAEIFNSADNWQNFLGKNLLIEDIDLLAYKPADLQHLFNAARESKNFILFTSATKPAEINFVLADLTSRLNSIPEVQILPPDDEIINLLLMKMLAEKNINATPEAVQYIIRRLPRSYKALADFVKNIDGKKLSEAAAREIFKKL